MTYNELLDIRNTDIAKTGAKYWLAEETTYFGNCLFNYYNLNDSLNYSSEFGAYGIRPVVQMVEGVYIASGTGTEADPYILGKD